MSDSAAVPSAPDTTSPNGLVPGGQQDDPNELRTDDFGLGGDLQKQLVDALTKRWNPDDPGAVTLDEPPADTAATPVPAPETSDAASAEPAVEDGAGDGRSAEDDGGAATQVPSDGQPAPAPTTDEFDAAAYFNQFFGTPLNREQAQQLAGLIGGLQSLGPAQRAQLDAILSGQDTGAYPATMGQPMQPAPQYNPNFTDQQQLINVPGGQQDPAVNILGPRPDDEYAAQQWDITARAVRFQQQETAQIQQAIAEQTQRDQQTRLAQAQAAIDQAEAAWRSEHALLSDGEWDGLKDRAVRSGTFPALLAAHHNDYNAAVSALYEQQFWADPALREKAIANVASGRQLGDPTRVDPNNPTAQQQAQTDAGRQALAASVAGGGGSITPQTNEVPRDPDKKKQAMVAELAAQHDFT